MVILYSEVERPNIVRSGMIYSDSARLLYFGIALCRQVEKYLKEVSVGSDSWLYHGQAILRFPRAVVLSLFCDALV